MIAEQIELGIPVAVCAWCKPKRNSCRTDPLSVTHGICPRHMKEMMDKVLRVKMRASNPEAFVPSGSGPAMQTRSRSRGRDRSGEPLLPLHF